MRAYEKGKVPQVVFGEGTANQAGKRLKAMGILKCLVVTDKGVINIGIVDPILQTLKDEGIDYIVYDKVEPDPPDYSCIEAAEILKESKCDATLAIGGGSSIDTAKAANLIASIPEKIDDLHDYSALGTKMKPSFTRTVKFIVIPTTSGTSAEVTGSAVISDTKRNLKYSFANPNLIADLNIIDPLLTVGMPTKPTAYCGVDILAHAIEILVGTQQSDFTNLLMLQCVERTWKWLPIATKEPKNIEARSQLSWASHNALSHGGVPNGHAVGHAIGALYHLVHGHACIVTLPTVVRHHAESSPDSIRDIANIIGVPTTEEDNIIIANRVADAILDFYKSLGLPTFKEAMKTNGINDDKVTYVKKMGPATLDDFKSRTWRPSIHDNDAMLTKVLEMIYDEE